MYKQYSASLISITLVLSFLPVFSHADEPVKRFKTLSDRRDFGVAHEITPWLRLSPSIEFESEVVELDLLDAGNYRLRERSKSMQLDIELIVTDELKAEIEYEYDDQLDEFVLEEAVAEFEIDDFKVELGRLYVPFGEYFSRFASGPALEFAETRARAVVFAYEPTYGTNDQLEASVYVFKSKLNQNLTDENNTDWGFSFNYMAEDAFSLGVSYLSDLSEADESVLEDNGFYLQKVDAVSAYTNIEFDGYEVSFEVVQALSHFAELDSVANQPVAWNIELGIYPEGNLDWAIRLEGSRELEDSPRLQVGINNTWRVNKQLTTLLEFFHGRFKKAFVEDGFGNEIESQNKVVAQVILSF